MLSQEKYLLVIDDDVDLAQELSTLLSTHGFVPIVANRVSEAITKLANQRFHCIILDLRLEKNSGVKVVRSIRNPKADNSFNFDTPILILSGFLDVETIRQLKDDVQAILAKPFQGEHLIEKVRQLGSGAAQAKLKAPPTRKLGPRTAEFNEAVHELAGSIAKLSLSIEALGDLIPEAGHAQREAMGKVERFLDLVSANLNRLRE